MNAIRSVRAHPPAIFSSPLQSSLGHKSSVISFRPVVTSSSRHPEPEPKNLESMDQKDKNPKEKSGDVMSHSFGEGYATRSNEEGFGGIYGGNETYDQTQESEVKEKEKARHQTHASS
ncbi:hypothetical protein CRYUN_Cryun22dG0111000 [Craigia yunnanensis]